MQRRCLLSALSLTFLLTLPLIASAQDAAQELPDIERPDVIAHVSGLACQMCARSLTKSLKELDAVDQVEVVLEKPQRVRLMFKAEQHATEDELRKAILDAGFNVETIEYPGADE